MKHRVLIINRYGTIRKEIVNRLEQRGVDIVCADSEWDAVFHLIQENFTLIFIEIVTCEDIKLLRELRVRDPVPIVAFSLAPSEEEELLALRSGADQYINALAGAEYCLAHIEAIMRRYELDILERRGQTLVIAPCIDLKIDLRLRRAYWKGQDLHLTPKQFSLLSVLSAYADEVVSKEQIYTKVWKNKYDMNSDEALKYHISGLRKTLEKHGAVDLIQTIWGVGYQLKSPSENPADVKK